jgi:hypothetical protein
MSVDRVKSLINAGDLQTLYENDQVRKVLGTADSNLNLLVEHSNGGWPYFPPLLGVKNHIYADL